MRNKRKEKEVKEVVEKDLSRAGFNTFINGLKKKFGPNSVFIPGEDDPKPVQAISTGIVGIDWASGIGGIPVGKIIEVFGNEGGGKSTLCLHIAATITKQKQR